MKKAQAGSLLKKIFLLLSILFLCSNCFCGVENADSLELLLGSVRGQERIEALEQLSNHYFRTDQDKAIRYAEQLLGLGLKNDDDKVLASAYKYLAYSYDISGNLILALSHYAEYLKILRKGAEDDDIAAVLNNMAILNRFLGNYDKALACSLEALKLRERGGDERKIGDIANNISIVYYYLAKYDEALKYCRISLAVQIKYEDKGGVANSYSMLANIFTEKNELEQALEYYRESIRIYLEIGDKEGLADTYNNIGNLYSHLKKYDLVTDYYNRSLFLEQELGNRAGVAASLNNIATAYQKLDKHDLSIDFCLRSVEIARKDGILGVLKNGYLNLSRSYAHKKDYRRAYEYHDRYIEVKDSLYGEEMGTKVAKMEFKYETDKKEREIELLKKDKDIRELEMNVQLSRQRAQRDLVLWGLVFIIIITFLIYSRLRSEKRSRSLIEKEKEKSDQLLLNILPSKVAEELKETGKSPPESFENVTVLFSDIVNFSAIAAGMEPKHLISELNDIFTAFDVICERNGCQRIKTIGDAYLSVCGLPEKDDRHAENGIRSALEMLSYLEKRNAASTIAWKVRIGIHSGKVVGGVVGIKKYAYDIFGDTINIASRMQVLSETMKINVTDQTFKLARGHFRFSDRGYLDIKNIGSMRMHFVEGVDLPSAYPNNL